MGRIRTYTIKPASFQGKHNATRAKCLLMLCHSATADQQSGWLTAHQLSLLTGLSYGSILSSVGKWVRWGQIQRGWGRLDDSGLAVFMYCAGEKGRTWLRRHKGHMPLDRYDSEMTAARGERSL